MEYHFPRLVFGIAGLGHTQHFSHLPLAQAVVLTQGADSGIHILYRFIFEYVWSQQLNLC